MLDAFFSQVEQVFHPKIFYFVNFFKETSYFIKKAKYSRPFFSEFLSLQLKDQFMQNLQETFSDGLDYNWLTDLPDTNKALNIYISYVPMFTEKIKKRGFNFSYLLAKKFYRELKKQDFPDLFLQTKNGIEKFKNVQVQFLEDFFTRQKNTKPLFNLKKESRIKEIKNAFKINIPLKIAKDDLNILLIIDDICTTGSTLMELMKSARSCSLFEDQIAFTIYGRNLK